MKALLIRPASIHEEVEVSTFEDVQNLVGGYVEVVRKFGQVYFVDEDGMSKNLNPNSVASLEMGCLILGNVVSMHPADAKEILG